MIPLDPPAAQACFAEAPSNASSLASTPLIASASLTALNSSLSPSRRIHSTLTGAGSGVEMSGEGQHRLRVNPILCNGFGFCAEIVPELISLDEWGFPIVNPGLIDDSKVLHLAERAVATCPRLALLLEAVPRA